MKNTFTGIQLIPQNDKERIDNLNSYNLLNVGNAIIKLTKIKNNNVLCTLLYPF